MTTANNQFFAILTAVGEAKEANAKALGIPWTFSQMGVGDALGAEPIPERLQTKLINECRRAPLNQIKVDPNNASVIIAEQIIPPDVGGWWIREIGLYDADGDLVAVANCAPSFKPLIAQGAGKTQVVRLNIIVSSASNVQLKIDPAVVLATREYVDMRVNTRLPLAGGEMTGDISMTEARVLNMIGDSSASWANGMVFRDKPTRSWKGAIGGWGGQAGLNNLYMALGPEPWSTGNGIRVTPTKLSFVGQMEGDGSLLSGLRWLSLTGAPTTLNGYGVIFASQSEAELGVETTKPMSALRVSQTIAAKVVQATTSKVGVARIASQMAAGLGEEPDTMITPSTLRGVLADLWQQAKENSFGVVKLASQMEVNVGAEDTKAITPTKMRYGVSWMFGARGHFAFPTWLGGLVINWGMETGISMAVDAPTEIGPTRDVTLSLAFPNEGFGVLSSMAFSTMAVQAAHSPGAALLSRSVVRLQNNYTASPGAIFWVAFGN